MLRLLGRGSGGINTKFKNEKFRIGIERRTTNIFKHETKYRNSLIQRRWYSTREEEGIFYNPDMELDDFFEEEIEAVKEEEISIKDRGTIWIGNIYPILNFILIPISASYFAMRHKEIVERLVKKFEVENDISYQLVILNEIKRKKEGGSYFNVEIYKNVPKRLFSPAELKKIEEKYNHQKAIVPPSETSKDQAYPSIDLQQDSTHPLEETDHEVNDTLKEGKEEETTTAKITTTTKTPTSTGDATVKESSIKFIYSMLSRSEELDHDDHHHRYLHPHLMKKDLVSEFVSILSKDFKEHPVYTSFFSLQSVKVFKVTGNPWYFEDLHRRYPTRRLVVSLIPKTVNFAGILDPSIVEDVFHKFRPFGKMNDLILGPYNKDTNIRTVTIAYKRISSAIAARSCLHRSLLYANKQTDLVQPIPEKEKEKSPPISDPAIESSVRILINYEIVSIMNLLTNTINKHTRLFALFLVLLLGLITYTIFDPLREFSCKSKIKGIAGFKKIKSVRWFQRKASQALNYIGVSYDYKDKKQMITLAQEQEVKVKQYLTRPPGMILYITGAPGTGKSRLVDLAKSIQSTYILYLDFGPMLGKSEDEFVKELAHSVGFFPAFTWTEWAGVVIDALTPGMGKQSQSSGGRTTKVLKILDTLFIALQSIHEEGGKIPLLIIEGFTADNRSAQEEVINHVVGWLDGVTHCKLARVIFTADSTFNLSGGLTELIPENRVDKITLTDVSLDNALLAVENEIGHEVTEDLVEAISRLGGRYNDIKAFLLKIQGGQSPESAINEMTDLAVHDVRSVLFNITTRNRQQKTEWSNVQLWRVICKIAENDYADYDDVLFNIFKGDDTALRALVRCKLFSVVPTNSVSDRIVATSPLILAAFKKICEDKYLRPGMDLLMSKAMLTEEQSKIEKCEGELLLFRKAEYHSPAIQTRLAYLMAVMEESQLKILKYDKIRRDSEATLKRMTAE